uniref:Cilia- and flagella-associated protein 157 n=1 Tax=Megaselia scalaris TaxID=36166 RepID=T1GGT2_MEGSC
MPPKKKGKKDKTKKKDDKDKLTQVDRTFYELTITDLNNKLARLRSHVAKIEETNDELTEKMRIMDEDRSDVTAEMSRIGTDTGAGESRSSNNNKNWENKFKAMEEQLTSEIKLLNGKLNSLEEFRILRDDMLQKFDEQEQKYKQFQKEHERQIEEMEAKAIVEKDQLKKEVEAKLLQLSEDFTKSSEIRIAGYTRRLIRENIALNKEMDKMIATQIRMEEDNEKMVEQNEGIKGLLTTADSVKTRLIKTAQKQVDIIKRMTTQYEILKEKYTDVKKYKKLYENAVKQEVVDRFSKADTTQKVMIMQHRVEALKREKRKLIETYKKFEDEVLTLRGVLAQIDGTIQLAVYGEILERQSKLRKPSFKGERPSTKDKKFDPRESGEIVKIDSSMDRENMLVKLQEIIKKYTAEKRATLLDLDTIVSEDSVYSPGKAGLKVAASITMKPLEIPDNTIIPKARHIASESLFDVETGTSLVFSSSQDQEEAVPEEEKEDEQQDAGGSSSTEESDAKPEKQPSVASIPSSTRATSVVSVKSDLQKVVEEGEGEIDEGEEEDLEIAFFY